MKIHKTLLGLIVLGSLLSATARAQESKPVYKEPAFIWNAVAAGMDFTVSRLVIDGKRIREANPLASSGGRLSTGRALMLKGLAIGLPALVYKFDRATGRRAMLVSAGLQSGAAIYSLAIRF